MPEPAPEPPIQILFASGILPRIHVRAVLHFARRWHQPGLARVGLVAEPAPAFVVVEVLVVGVVLVDAIDRIGFVHVPADKVDGYGPQISTTRLRVSE